MQKEARKYLIVQLINFILPFCALFLYERYLEAEDFTNYIIFTSYFNGVSLLYTGPRSSYLIQQEFPDKVSYNSSHLAILIGLFLVSFYWRQAVLLFMAVLIARIVWKDTLYQAQGLSYQSISLRLVANMLRIGFISLIIFIDVIFVDKIFMILSLILSLTLYERDKILVSVKVLFLLTVNSMVPLLRGVLDKWWGVNSFETMEFNNYALLVTVSLAFANFCSQFFLHRHTDLVRKGKRLVSFFDKSRSALLLLGAGTVSTIVVFYLDNEIYWVLISTFYIISSFLYSLGFGILLIQGQNTRVVVANLIFAVSVASMMALNNSLEWFLLFQGFVSITLIIILIDKEEVPSGL